MTDDLKARLRNFGHIYAHEAADRIEALELALTQSRAETAAVIERIADEVCRWSLAASEEIRALATADQTAALDAIKAEARAQGMREAAEECRQWQNSEFPTEEEAIGAMVCHDLILAAIKGAKA